MSVFGPTSTSIAGTLTAGVGGFAATRMGSISDSLTGAGDLYPTASLKWHDGVHNWMTYVTGDIPVGAYNPNRISNIGIGHGAIDGGGGYTYLNPATGHELSGVGGFTYNFKIPIPGFRAASISISTGVHLSSSRSSSLSVLSDMPISRSPTTPVGALSSVASGRGCWRWPADRVSFPDWKHAGVFEPERIWRIRCGQSAIGLEHLADVLISPAAPESTVTPTRHLVTKCSQ